MGHAVHCRPPAPGDRAALRRRGLLADLGAHAVLAAGSALMILPLAWMVSTSLKTYPETLLTPPRWLPAAPQWQNYAAAWAAQPLFGRYFLNSAVVTAATVAAEVILSLLAAYAFSRMHFAGRRILFLTMLSTMMVPGEVLLVPNFITLTRLGWINTYYALIVPWVVSAFAVFLLRQHLLQIPLELQEAAWLDGAGHLRFLFQVVVPLMRAPLAAVALLKVIGSWNAFLWPLIVTNTPAMRTLPVGLMAMMQDEGPRYHIWMAAAAMALAPVIAIFLAAQRQFLESVARSGLKG